MTPLWFKERLERRVLGNERAEERVGLDVEVSVISDLACSTAPLGGPSRAG